MGDKIQYLRDNVVSVDNIQLSREAYLEPDGKLTQEFGIWDHDSEKLLAAGQWQFEGVDDPKLHLRSLDSHWEQLSEEFKRVAEHARRYAAIKTGGNEHDIKDITADAVKDMSQGLLYQYASDQDIAAGEDNARIPLLSFSQRYMSIRESSYDSQVEFDDFEMAMIDLNMGVSKAIQRFDNIVHGMDADEPHTREENMENEAYGNEDDRGGDFDLDGGDDDDTPDFDRSGGGMATAGDDDDEKESWHTDADSWKKGGSWNDDGFNPERERESQIDDIINRYLNQMKNFMQSAEELWLDAATQASEGKRVTRNDKALASMKYWQNEAAGSYEDFKEALADASSLSVFELDPVYEPLDDEEKGPAASMQKLISMASRPELLESAIKKGLPPERKRA
jgi:hypothetical protein